MYGCHMLSFQMLVYVQGIRCLTKHCDKYHCRNNLSQITLNTPRYDSIIRMCSGVAYKSVIQRLGDR